MEGHLHNSIIRRVKKRDGRIVEFAPERITNAILKAAQAIGGSDDDLAKDLTKNVITVLEYKYDLHEIPTVEDIQDIVSKLREKNIGILITDHNVHETLTITDRAYLLFEGRILKSGTSAQLADDEHVRKVYLGKNFELRR